ncbi:RNA polymerase sigma factor [Sphingobacterium sp. SGR-19]|uniref:RNA polymerase sigma factor n=1 Tax=Sphingobacterium sp. SGR-19 TaxID=2710886 RepID=UPI0013EA272A|nr:RNA polymerase sigma-70 factor [Sphingobacterium sp. SGR-19]NGM66311.1 RNA polymerase sigma-70 factor [Sphingobacterium sp. SGR-19]
MKEEEYFDEAKLLEEMKQDNIAAFNQLYNKYAPILYQRLLRLLKNPESVEEILQDVFLKIWNKREEIKPEKGFKTFIYRMADHMAIDLFRKIGRDKAMQLELWAASVSFYLHTEEQVFDKEKAGIIQEAIRSLPPKRREILIQCKLEDKSYKEVAEMMGISVSTVSNQLVSAMKDIREYIVKNYREDYLISLIFIAILSF